LLCTKKTPFFGEWPQFFWRAQCALRREHRTHGRFFSRPTEGVKRLETAEVSDFGHEGGG
jgi:hypothetical protein